MIKKSPYEVLELEGDFEFKDIKKAYRRAILANPPEQNPKKFAQISDAYDMLSKEEYFIKGAEDFLSILNVQLELREEESLDRSKYLKNSFEVPFKI